MKSNGDKMNLLVICPSNRDYMPYLDNYSCIFKDKNINLTYLVWDRMQKREIVNFRYNDNKKSLRRNFFDYLKFTRYVKKTIKEGQYDYILLFSIQLISFLGRFISKQYKNKYILDIRDYHKLIDVINIKHYVDNSYMTVISSAGFKKWMPKSEKIILNHNTNATSIPEIEISDIKFPLTIGTIGSLKHININKKLIEMLGNNELFELIFDGYGPAKETLEKFVLENKYENVIFTGEYNRIDKEKIYLEKDMISVIYDNHGINNLTLLPNRLYDGLLYGKPLVAMNGTYLADIVKKYKIGIVIDRIENVEKGIIDYVKTFNKKVYEENRNRLFEMIIKENQEFLKKLYDINRGR